MKKEGGTTRDVASFILKANKGQRWGGVWASILSTKRLSPHFAVSVPGFGDPNKTKMPAPVGYMLPPAQGEISRRRSRAAGKRDHMKGLSSPSLVATNEVDSNKQRGLARRSISKTSSTNTRHVCSVRPFPNNMSRVTVTAIQGGIASTSQTKKLRLRENQGLPEHLSDPNSMALLCCCTAHSTQRNSTPWQAVLRRHVRGLAPYLPQAGHREGEGIKVQSLPSWD